ncbi:hypothetical protein WKW79_26965 [Variovorax robiniae]|uniref:Uncharacterized protein n=1 Tax=Variovorax robiniae TaxID=1836199 RepID=A0ABU8XEK2_9BURK
MQRIWLPVALALSLLGAAWAFRPVLASEWAAWVQVFGVLLALGWSVRLQGLAASQGERQAAQVAASFASNMHWVFRELSDACAKRSWADYKVHRRILEEILSQGREVTLQLLDGRSLAMVTSLRSLGVEALEVTEPHDPDGHWPPLQSYFEKRLPSIAAWLSATGNPSESNGPTDYAGLRTSLGNL